MSQPPRPLQRALAWLLAACCLCFSLLPVSLQAGLTGLEATPEFDKWRITLQVTAGTKHKYFLLDSPDRLVLDLLDSPEPQGLDLQSVAQGPVKALRLASRGKDLRLVFHLSSAVSIKTFRLGAQGNKPERLVLELTPLTPLNAQPAAPRPASQQQNSPPKDEKADPPAEQGAEQKPQQKAEQKSEQKAEQKTDQKTEQKPGQAAAPQAPTDTRDPPKNTTERPKAPAAPLAQPAAQDADHSPQAPQDKSAESHSAIRGRKIVVALDAGHGGKDTGAIGARGVREKDVVLAISRELGHLFHRDGRYKVINIRAGDQFIPLKSRRDRARQLKADVFISIHADAFVSPAAKGASVFALSQRGATSEMARFLADHENSSDLLGSVGGVSLGDKDEVLAGVLVDLSMTATLANSLDLGARVLREMGKVTRLHNHRVEQAGFMVLKSPDVPSILVETGFISNPEEAALLNTHAHRQRLAQAIFRGVNSYFSLQTATPRGARDLPEPAAKPQAPASEADQPPPSSLKPQVPSVRPDTPKIDTRPRGGAGATPEKPRSTPQPKRHKVVAGDTLAKIAARYGVSQKALQNANQLKDTVVKTGQTLKIPEP